MKKKITLITSILLILALAVTFVGCNKDKETTEPTTEASEKVSTTEPTTKFEAPEIKDEPTTEETTEETTEAPETTTKKATYSYSSSGSSSNSSSNKGTSSTTKASATTTVKSYACDEVLDDGRVVVVTNANGGGVYIDDSDVGGHSSADDPQDWDEDGDIDADDDEYLEMMESCTDYGR